jgi:hypothetical protein
MDKFTTMRVYDFDSMPESVADALYSSGIPDDSYFSYYGDVQAVNEWLELGKDYDYYRKPILIKREW